MAQVLTEVLVGCISAFIAVVMPIALLLMLYNLGGENSVLSNTKSNNRFYIKRIIASSPDEINIEMDFLKLIKKSINPRQTQKRKIKLNSYFVMGDNDQYSYESRH